MSSTTSSREGAQRVWSDPLFFALIGAIAGAYVLLIVAMLAADALYLLTGTPDVPVALEFETDGSGKLLSAGSDVSEAYRKYGLAIDIEESRWRPRLLDSRAVPWRLRALGTPHVDFGGPGVGAGGRRRAKTSNRRDLGKVLMAAGDEPLEPRYECRFEFVSGVRVSRIEFERPVVSTVQVLLITESGGETIASIEPGTKRFSVPEGETVDEVLRLVLASDADFGRVVAGYELAGRAIGGSGDGSASANGAAVRVFVSDMETARLDIANERVGLRLRWSDPVSIDQVMLLNLTDTATLRMEARAGKVLRTMEAGSTGANGVRELDLDHWEGTTLAIDLPSGAAVASIRFRWRGRVAGAWEREHPRLARWTHNPLITSLQKPEIRYSIKLTMVACTMTTVLSLWVAVPVGYLLSRYRFPFHNLIDAVLDIPIVLPPLVVGLSLLILFQFFPRGLQERVVYEIPAVILAQFAVSCAFAVRSMRGSFMQIDRRREQVALTLGCSRAQAFFHVVLPEAGKGMLTAATLAWARALGEFGPLLVFAGATRMKTEVLSTTVFLELSVGDLGAAVAVSLIMVASAIVVLVLARMWGSRVLSL